MSFEVVSTPNFLNEAKRLTKKYSSLKNDISNLASQLTLTPVMGVPLGKDVYKIRLAIHSKGKGKSGGARIITCVRLIANRVYLISIFDKSDKENITDKTLKELIKNL